MTTSHGPGTLKEKAHDPFFQLNPQPGHLHSMSLIQICDEWLLTRTAGMNDHKAGDLRQQKVLIALEVRNSVSVTPTKIKVPVDPCFLQRLQRVICPFLFQSPYLGLDYFSRTISFYTSVFINLFFYIYQICLSHIRTFMGWFRTHIGNPGYSPHV